MRRRTTLLITAAAVTAGVTAVASLAGVPTLTSVSAPDGYAAATFNAPRASYLTFFVATKPDRASDGQFLEGNVVVTEILVDEEARSGRWRSETELAPGRYWVMLQARPDDDCYVDDRFDPACADGYSEPAPIVVSAPAPTYSTAVRPGTVAVLTLRRSTAGATLAYRVCYPTAKGVRACRTGRIAAQARAGSLRVPTAALARTTTFTWSAGGATIATKRARVR